MLGLGTSASPYLVSSADEFNDIRNNLSAYYLLTNDIDMNISPYNEGVGFVPIGDLTNKFLGSFDGGEYTVSNMYINNTNDNSAPFGYVNTPCIIKNVRFEDITVYGARYVGGICGSATSVTVQNCRVINGNINNTLGYGGGLIGYASLTIILNCMTSGVLHAQTSYSGGLVGYISCQSSTTRLVSFCYSSMDIIGDEIATTLGGLFGRVLYKVTIQNCYATGSVTGRYYVGGFVGSLYSTSSYTTYLNNNFSTGQVTGIGVTPNYIYGFCGSYTSSYVSYTYQFYDKEKAGVSVSAMGTSKTTLQMSTASTFTGWNMVMNWEILDGATNPTLKYFHEEVVLDANIVVPVIENTLTSINPTISTITVENTNIVVQLLVNSINANNPIISTTRNVGIVSNLLINSLIPINPIIIASRNIIVANDLLIINSSANNPIISVSRNINIVNELLKVTSVINDISIATNRNVNIITSVIENITIPNTPIVIASGQASQNVFIQSILLNNTSVVGNVGVNTTRNTSVIISKANNIVKGISPLSIPVKNIIIVSNSIDNILQANNIVVYTYILRGSEITFRELEDKFTYSESKDNLKYSEINNNVIYLEKQSRFKYSELQSKITYCEVV
ncbi:hypothetical protein [Clostridium lacusfryxellense]|uniref:hypothetical protein n=1 Tax=Clostridium lacusfryxellense TaxID=205328 RepID=UPI001C0BF5B0|nr:hypothetical protein [Clostridium lacusfryxellense]MBU3112119.1 hypothetical protein [Clostridium lacusfryxellense]